METERIFYVLRDKLALENKLYEDDSFKSDEVVLQEFGSDHSFHSFWARPKTLLIHPEFVSSDEISRFQRGKISSDLFAVIVDILCQKTYLWAFVVAEDQSFSQNYAGTFLFRFWRLGKAVPVVIDDILPFSNDDSLLLSSFENNRNMWCTLLEKSYAKFLGSYAQLQNVTLPDAISDILGCSVHSYSVKTERYRIFEILRKNISRNGIAIVKICDPSLLNSYYDYNEFTTDNIWFSVTSIDIEENEGLKQPYVTLKNPYITQIYGIEEYIDPNNKMDTLKIALRVFLEVVNEVYVGISRFPGLFSNPQSGLRNWETQNIWGKWINAFEASGRSVLRLTLPSPGDRSTRSINTVILSLRQIFKCNKNPNTRIGLNVYELKGKEKYLKIISTKFLAQSKPIVETSMHPIKEIGLHLYLKPGQYLIVPEVKFRDSIPPYHHRYNLMLFSLYPVTIENNGFQKYGKDFLLPLQIMIDAPQYVQMGHPVRMVVKITEFPRMTRLTITLMLSFNRISEHDNQEQLIKARQDQIEVCFDLLDKELSMNVYYYEYIKFPLKTEEFIVRCSAFIHEFASEIKCYKVVTTILPKVEMKIDKTVFAGQSCYIIAFLQNTLPLCIPASQFKVICLSNENEQSSKACIIPPFATTWIICTLTLTHPGTHTIATGFSSPLFIDSVSRTIQVMNNTSERSLHSGSKGPLLKEKETIVKQYVCCPKHGNLSKWKIENDENSIGIPLNFGNFKYIKHEEIDRTKISNYKMIDSKPTKD